MPTQLQKENQKMEFKEFLTLKRKEKQLTLRKFALLIGISPAFLCDLESGNRSFPANSKKYPDLLEKMIAALELDTNEKELFISLASKSMLEKDKVPQEVKTYLQNVPLAQQALRKATEVGATSEQWEEFIKTLEGKNK